jgi:hypothetical protein
MYLLLKKGKLENIMLKASKKAKSQKELSLAVKIPRSKIWSYRVNNIALEKSRIERIAKYADVKIEKEDIEKELPDNWRQKIGGKNCVIKKIKEGVLDSQLKKCRIKSAGKLGEWHKQMKKKDPEAYHLSQYEKFKKIGGYKFITKNREKVRNILEKETADTLKNLNFKYQYEPLIRIEHSYFFPDFLVEGKIILECTMWRGYDKAIKLKEKIKQLKKSYKVYVIIPEKLKKYYSSISEHLITDIAQLKNLSS